LGGNNSHLQGTRGFALPAYLQAMPGGWVLHNREVLIAISSTRVTTQNIAVALI
jgi:hypothetical protein